jgi:hypothetical protein
MKKVILLMAVTVSIFTACKKNTTTTSGTGDKKTYLTKAPWKYSKIEAQVAGTTVWVAISSQNQICEKDNIETFSTANTYIVDEGVTKCSATDPQTEESGTWAFVSSDTKLNINNLTGTSPSNDTATIATLNDNILALDYADGSNGTIRITLKH